MKKIILLFFILGSVFHAEATHLMGGSMTYAYTGFDIASGKNQFHVTLKIYRYCDASGGGTASLDASMMLGVYDQDILNPTADKNWLETDNLLLTSQQFITPPALGATCNFTTTVCVEEGIFEADILLAPSTGGYHLIVERCCRNGNIINLSNPGGIGQSYYCFIPPDPLVNSSPILNDVSVPYLCTSDTATVVNTAVDPDGDSLVYSFESPYIGNSGTTVSIPDPQIDNNPYAFPISNAIYTAGYSVASPFGATGYASIDPYTGLTKYYVPNAGFYVVVIEIKEYRNGVLISSVRRDLQIIAIVCPPNSPPAYSLINGSGINNYTITEGQTLCFPVIFTDPNGDSLYLNSSGTIFNSGIVNPTASLANASGNGIVNSQFCWSTDCGQSKPSPYQFTVTVTDNGCPPKISNVVYSIKVNPSGPPSAAVTISPNPAGPICTGTLVTFTAIPTFGGTSPQYQWFLNGLPVGSNSNIYSSSALNNGDVITVIMTSNSVCVPGSVANSPPLVMTVNAALAPTVTISATPPGTVCSGTNITFTANPVNPGATPTYQWLLNGTNVGTNSNTYSNNSLIVGSTVAVTLTANANCPAAASNSIVMSVNPLLAPSVTIGTATTFPSCPGQSVTFNATPVNGGSTPAYQWQVNGVNAGTNSSAFTTTTLNNGDVVTVILTSSVPCPSPVSATSNAINVTIDPPAVPSVSIVASPAGPICAQDNVTFTATPVLGGTSPVYQWTVNGAPVGINSNIFNSANLTNGAIVQVALTSNSVCATTPTVSSNTIVMVVNPLLATAVSITSNPAFPICPGAGVTFTAVPVNGGSSPAYQWQVDGVNVGTNSSVFSSSALTNGQVIRVKITSNGTCVSPSTAFSNNITAIVTPNAVPAVTIAANPSTPICFGTNVTFTATPTNGGVTPVYQWRINGVNTGTNSSSFSSSTLNNNDIISVILTSSAACPLPASIVSNNIVMVVNPLLTPQVSIAAVPSGMICAGTPVTFSATTINGGTTPILQWHINGINTGITNPSFTFTNLQNGDVVTAVLTSNALCATPSKDTSNNIVMIVNPIVTPAVTISPNPAGPICDGTSVTFTANPVNEGTAPVYHWTVNGSPVGNNLAQYTSALLHNGDTIAVNLISNEVCTTTNTANSNQIIQVVYPILTPSVTISSSADTICPNDNVIFNAVTVNPGNNPVYEWMINGVITGGNSSGFSYSHFNNGETVSVQLHSNAICVVPDSALSNVITIIVKPNLTPAISFIATPDTIICPGTPVSFIASTSNGGSSPSFQWEVNGNNTGPDSNVFTTSLLQNNDIIQVVLTSSASCALPVTATSNQYIAQVDPLLLPVINISANPAGTICDGTWVDYSASILNGGPGPAYQWTVNGNAVGTNQNLYSSSTLADGDTVVAFLTSNVHCPAQNPVPSNQIIIDRLPPLNPVITGINEICIGKDATMNVLTSGGNGGPYYYTWDNNLGTGTSFTLSPPATTTYTVTVSDSCSTIRTTSFTIQVDPLPIPSFEIYPPNATILNPYFDLNDHSQNTAVWFWNFGDHQTSSDQSPKHTYTLPGYYNVQLIATSQDGCVDSLTKQLYVEEVTTVYVPNSFTPNGDGKNDFFNVIGHAVPAYNMTIFNRWGQVVYTTGDGIIPWNGNYKNGAEPAPQATYIYDIVFSGDSAPHKEITGRVTLIR